MKNKLGMQKGITLIILVVTIVVILILAGITINLAFDENGIIKRAKGLQGTINQSIANEEYELDKLKNHLEGSLINADIGGNPNINDIGGGGEESDVPQKPKVKVNGTQGEEGCYRSDVEIVVTANDRAHSLTYTVEGTGIDQGSIQTETSIGNGQRINITKDGTFTVTIYEYNRDGQKSEGMQVTITRDTVPPTANLTVTRTEEDSITVQLVAIDPEPSEGLATSNPYTMYYKETGTDTWVEAEKGATSTYTYTNLKPNTSYSLKAEVTDKAGNTGTSNELTNVQVGTIDDTKPGIKPITPREPETIKLGDTSTEIILTPTEQPVTIDPDKFIPVDENGNPITEPNTKVTVTQDEEGNIHITITGGDTEGTTNVEIQPGGITDPAGNENEKITIDTNITVDNTKPTMEITEPVEGTIIKKDETIEITITPSEEVTINNDKIILTGDGSTGTTTSVSQDPDGTIHIVVTGGEGTGKIGIQIEEGFLTDKAGNPSSTQTLPTYSIDNEAPTVQAVVTGTTTNSITVQATVTDNGPAGLATENTYTYHITGNEIDKTITTTEASYTFIDLPQKQECTITVTVSDAKGNTGSMAVTAATGTVPEGTGNIAFSEIAWKCDETTSYEEIASITITKTNSQTEYKMQYQTVEKGNQTTEEGWIEVAEDSITLEGLHHEEMIYARLKDSAGNAGDTSSASILDKNAPTITEVGAPSKTYIKNGQTATYTITTSETVALVDSTKATITGIGSTGCTVSITGSGTNFTATVTGGTGNGAVTLDLAAGLFKDTAGNANSSATTKTGLTIDNTPPIMTISPASGAVTKTRNVMVTISDNGSGLSSSNNLTYYLSTSDTNPTEAGYQTGTYTSGTAFTLGTDLTGTYYLFLPIVADNAGNTSTATITGYYRCGTYIFDNDGPTITNFVLNNATVNGFTVTMVAKDNGTAGLDTSNTYTIYYRAGSSGNYTSVNTNNTAYTFNNLVAGTNYQVYVVARDKLGNVSAESGTKSITTIIYTWKKYKIVSKIQKVLVTKSGNVKQSQLSAGGVVYCHVDNGGKPDTALHCYALQTSHKKVGYWLGHSSGTQYYISYQDDTLNSEGEVTDVIYYYSKVQEEQKVDSAGDFVSIVTSIDPNTYPNDGKHTDGYWYIKQ